jgi:uncharacterized repeat protein (TIGR01451 family)/LPXTG-motif cell wall-anchored protein
MHLCNDLICNVNNPATMCINFLYLILIFICEINQEMEIHMSKVTSLIRRAPKRFTAAVAMVAAAIIIPAAAFAWGPDRPTFTTANPAGYVTFNSITDNPAHGDERNFVQVKEASAANSTYADSISLSAGKEYTVFMYYHNNAASNLNASGKGVALNAYAKAQIPAVVANGSNGTKAVGYIGASNANPTQVWDDISFSNTTGGDIALRYVDGSAKIFNRGATNGATLSDNIITSGAPIGHDALNGTIPGCNEFAGYITFTIKADQPNFTIQKQVRLAGTTEWKESVEAKPGATVEYQIEYKNTGTTEQRDVVLKDRLPANVTYVTGSTYIKNTSNPNGKLVSDNLTTATGINIGHYTPGSNAFVKFSAKVNGDIAAYCETTTLKNVARVETSNGSKEDGADVVVKSDKVCEPGKITVCEIATNKIISIDESQFDASKHTKDLSKCELPQTGTTENIVAVTGLGALIASIAYYVASRRALNL